MASAMLSGDASWRGGGVLTVCSGISDEDSILDSIGLCASRTVEVLSGCVVGWGVEGCD